MLVLVGLEQSLVGRVGGVRGERVRLAVGEEEEGRVLASVCGS